MFFLLGDTSYGSCCVDEVAGSCSNYPFLYQQLNILTQILLFIMERLASVGTSSYFKHTYLCRTSRLPVYYVFIKSAMDVEDFMQQFTSQFESMNKRVLVFFDTPYEFVVNSKLRDSLLALNSDDSIVIVTSLKDKYQLPLKKEGCNTSNSLLLNCVRE
jgi:diphthamide synthase subunit DPH2